MGNAEGGTADLGLVFPGLEHSGILSVCNQGQGIMTTIEKVARAICDADPFAPDPDAPIYIKMKKAKAWEGRIEMAQAAINALKEKMV